MCTLVVLAHVLPRTKPTHHHRIGVHQNLDQPSRSRLWCLLLFCWAAFGVLCDDEDNITAIRIEQHRTLFPIRAHAFHDVYCTGGRGH